MKKPRPWAILSLLLLSCSAAAEPRPASSSGTAAAYAWGGFLRPKSPQPIAREDWILAYEPDTPKYWGIDWGYTTGTLPQRAVIRGAHEVETDIFDNFRFQGRSWILRFAGMGMRGGAYSFENQFTIDQLNIQHVYGHDAFARMAAGENPGITPPAPRFSQILPHFLGGSELASGGPGQPSERDAGPVGQNADYDMMMNMQPEEALNEFAYRDGKQILAGSAVNTWQLMSYIAFKQQFLRTEAIETGPLVACSTCGSTDFQAWAADLNQKRYGAAAIGQFRVTMDDVHRGYSYQLLDPIFWESVVMYAKDWIILGKNETHMPMIPLGYGVEYLPSLRTYFTPFGVDYFQDNYFRCKGALVNAYWTRGDDKWQRRSGVGVDVDDLRAGPVTFGLFGARLVQPPIDLTRVTPITDLNELHVVSKVGGWVKAPLWRRKDGSRDPMALILYSRLCLKNYGWMPGEYLFGRVATQVGLGLHF